MSVTKLKLLPQPLTVAVKDSNARIVVTDVGRDADGLPRARLTLVLGAAIVAPDIIRLEKSEERRSLARRMLKGANERATISAEAATLTHEAIERAIEECGLAVRTVLPPVAERGSSSPASIDPEANQYIESEAGLLFLKPTRDGDVPMRLTNFRARITAEVAHDDGAETTRHFEIAATLKGRTITFKIPASQFNGMGWATEHLGGEAIVFAGFGAKDHARCAIQVFSAPIAKRTVYGHTGWRRVGNSWLYLHAGGALDANGVVDGIEVSLPDALSKFRLPLPPSGEDLVRAICASLSILDAAPDTVSIPVYAALWRAAISGSDLSVHICGPTQQGKTTFAALVQQHWGPGLSALHLPASWSSTANANEMLAFVAKDAVLVVDDFAPSSSLNDAQRSQREAERLLRAQGNRSGRGRLRSDGTPRPPKPPRGLILSTGEDIPKGQSLRARIVAVELAPGDLDWQRVTALQAHGADGEFARALSAFIVWLAPRYEEALRGVHQLADAIRSASGTAGGLRRLPHNTAELAAGLHCFLSFATEARAITEAEKAALWARALEALRQTTAEQGRHQEASEPARRFLELISSAIASGHAHIADKHGGAPPEPASWGWRQLGGEWRPQGDRIGWLDGTDLYLEPDASFNLAQKLARDAGETLPVSRRTLGVRLREARRLKSYESGRHTVTVRRMMEGQRRKVLHFEADALSSDEPGQSADSAPARAAEPSAFASWAVPGSNPAETVGDTAHTQPAAVLALQPTPDPSGQFGQFLLTRESAVSERGHVAISSDALLTGEEG